MPAKVLVVDDARSVRNELKEILVSSGRYSVIAEASSGEEAVEKCRELQPDLVTMDIAMPGMDGIEATRRILEQDYHVRVVMCSAPGQEMLVIESIAVGAKDFVVKPLTPDSVLQIVDSVMNRKAKL